MKTTSFSDEELSRLLEQQRKIGMDRAMTAWFISTVIAAVAIGFSDVDAEKALYICSTFNAAAFILTYFSK